MTTNELLAYCQTRKYDPYIPDLVWQHEMQRDGNLSALCSACTPPNGFHDMYDVILEARS